ncbi:DUF2306 domain-containing protein [Litorivivens sp.]|uniref:DUF2306 domain-containing protein n=1 Tax=Litorivivens sp. TaxID=2020868 RepID=UPI00356813F3
MLDTVKLIEGVYMSDRNIVGFLGWLILALVCMIYAPVAAEYMLRFFDVPSLELWDRLYASVVGNQQALGPGSVRVVQHDVYTESRWAMLIHTVLGSVVLLLVASQFVRPLRQHYPAVHRWVGRSVIALGTVSMVAAACYLVKTGAQATFSGPAFYAQLWALTIFTLVALWMGFVAILLREIQLHQCLMIYAFALFLTAPLLRVAWLGLGLIWPDVTQEYLNVAAGIILGFLAPGGAAVAGMSTALTSGNPARKPTLFLPGLGFELTAGLVAIVSGGVLYQLHTLYIGPVDRILITATVTATLVLAIFAARVLTSYRRGDLQAAEEWRIHTVAVLGSLPIGLLLWGGYAVFFTPAHAFYAMTLTGPAVSISSGYGFVLWRRWQNKPSRVAAGMKKKPGLIVSAAS